MSLAPSKASPGPLPGDLAERFFCSMLRCSLRARCCIVRQAKSDAQRTQQTSRGQGTDHPSCDSRTCEQGRRIREALDPGRLITWRGAWVGGRFAREHATACQLTARRRLELGGALDVPPSIDDAPGRHDQADQVP